MARPSESGAASCSAIHSGLARRSLARSSGLPAKVLRKTSRAMGRYIGRHPTFVIPRRILRRRPWPNPALSPTSRAATEAGVHDMADDAAYEPPKVWEWNKENG